MIKKQIGRIWLGALCVLSGCGYAVSDNDETASEKSEPGVFNVRDYGARGDGKTNDSAAFQQAKADALAYGEGAVITVPAGEYALYNVSDAIAPWPYPFDDGMPSASHRIRPHPG